jgi:hypothetical protein
VTRTQITVKLEQKKERLQMYLDREKYMLSQDAVQSYGVGSRNLQRYSTDLADIQKMIEALEDEIAELEAQQSGLRPRKSVGIVPRDW